VVAEGGVSLEGERAQPAPSPDDLGALADWGEGPLFEACGMTPSGAAEQPACRARPAWPRGMEGRRLIAQEYRADQEDGVDSVLAVMCATGHSRRKSLRLISQARDGAT